MCWRRISASGSAAGRTCERCDAWSIGSFGDIEALALEQVAPERVRPPEELVRDLPGAVAPPDLAQALGHGKAVDRLALGLAGEGPWAVVDESGRLVAICSPHGPEKVKPVVVLQPAGGSGSDAESPAADE